MSPKIIAYQRCSVSATDGLDAQRLVIQRYAAQHGATVIASFDEVETGRKDHTRNRPRLESAIAHSRRTGATLVIASLDRLTRSVLVTTKLLASGVDFVAVDAPHANRFTIVLLAAMAEHEGRLISERTKAAMAAARERGLSFTRATWHFSPETRLKAAVGAAESHRSRALDAYADIAPIAVVLRESGKTWTAIGRHLNALGHVTRSGGQWSVATTRRLFERATRADRQSERLVLANFEAVRGQRVESHRDSPVRIGLPAAVDPPDLGHAPRTRVAISYLRVSTKMQGCGGLGIASQRATVRAYSESAGLRVLREFVEVESGAKSEKERPELSRALALAKAVNGVLLIARLDRLARSVATTSRLLDAGVEFVCCDAPYANVTTIQMLSMLAEHETRMLSQRMRASIAAQKRAGRVRRHVSNLSAEDRRNGIRAAAAQRVAKTEAACAYVTPLIIAMRDRGLSCPAIAASLRADSFVTQRGRDFDVQTVARILKKSKPNARPKAYRSRASRAANALSFEF